MTRYKDFGAALLAYRNRPEGEPAEVQTNWTTIPANDNASPEEVADFSFERKLLITPSVEEIMRNVEAGPTARNDKGQIVRIGNLRFSDGTQTERDYCYGVDDKVIQYDRRMPAGAMLGTREKAESQLGGKGITKTQLNRSNDFFAETLGTNAPTYKTRGKRRNGKSIKVEEARRILANAIANTPIMPTVTKLPTALPCGAERVADSFLGMQKAKKGEAGSIMWQDIASSTVHREIWDEALASMKEEYVETLEKTLTARTLADIAPGGHKRSAERRGKRLIEAANDNLHEALRKVSA